MQFTAYVPLVHNLQSFPSYHLEMGRDIENIVIYRRYRYIVIVSIYRRFSCWFSTHRYRIGDNCNIGNFWIFYHAFPDFSLKLQTNNYEYKW